MAAGQQIPVTVVTGFLGAGKTTLVNHLLSQTRDRLAVIVNEFGDIGIDGDLITTGDEELIELSSGCICCVVRGDLIKTLRRLVDTRDDLDGIVIETTGLANPSPVIQTFYADQILAARCRLDAVVTVADALHAPQQIASEADAADQVALASVIVMNKSAECTAPDAFEAALRGLNPFAMILNADRGRVAPEQVLGTNSFALERVADHLEADTGHDHSHGHGQAVANAITSVSLESDLAFDAEALEAWLSDLLAVRGEQILRVKGLIWVAGEPRKLVLHAVHMLMEGDFTTAWDGGPPHRSRLVFIGRDLSADTLRRGFLGCATHS